jgi:predicted nucleic acid-binding protein
MRHALDSSVLLDVLLRDADHAEASLSLLETASTRGSIVLCPVAWAECAASFAPTTAFAEAAADMGIIYDDFTPEVAALAAHMWRDYRRQGGPRGRVMADFLIGAHAQVRADCLLTRDRGYFRSYFHGLRVIEP